MDPAGALSAALAQASTAVLGRALQYTEADLQRILSPSHFVAVRTTYGGPAPAECARAIAESQRKLSVDRESWRARRDDLQKAEAQLKARAGAL